MTKRGFDLLSAALALIVLWPLMFIAAMAVRLGSPGPVVFRQQRIGREFRSFTVYKFRTMRDDATGADITSGSDPRITRVGRILRETKIDELPQLFNILKGDMSIVGPRPELPRYVEMFRTEYEYLLTVRPGLTDPASLHYRNEQQLLAGADDPTWLYETEILPHKLALSREYVDGASFRSDLRIVTKTLRALVKSPSASPNSS